MRLHRERKRREEVAARLAKLSVRAHHVLNTVRKGMPNKAVGVKLGVGMKTVEVHRFKAIRKLGVTSIAELLRFKVEACVEDTRIMHNRSASIPV